MKKKNYSLLVLIATSLGIIGLLVFWVPSFFADEFYTISIAYEKGSVKMIPPPDELRSASVSKWTDVSATFKNSSDGPCQVEVQSFRFSKNFEIKQNAEYGLILPQNKSIAITFCGVRKDILID
ncbi:MAG: hypothetical protein WCV85_06770 [Patescibacteria group bacterium]|jgi:hypothetical protein